MLYLCVQNYIYIYLKENKLIIRLIQSKKNNKKSIGKNTAVPFSRNALRSECFLEVYMVTGVKHP